MTALISICRWVFWFAAYWISYNKTNKYLIWSRKKVTTHNHRIFKQLVTTSWTRCKYWLFHKHEHNACVGGSQCSILLVTPTHQGRYTLLGIVELTIRLCQSTVAVSTAIDSLSWCSFFLTSCFSMVWTVYAQNLQVRNTFHTHIAYCFVTHAVSKPTDVYLCACAIEWLVLELTMLDWTDVILAAKCMATTTIMKVF